jgi:hypothetical protein
MTDANQPRFPQPLQVDTIGEPVAVDALARVLLARLERAPKLRVIDNEQSNRSIPPVVKGPL